MLTTFVKLEFYCNFYRQQALWSKGQVRPKESAMNTLVSDRNCAQTPRRKVHWYAFENTNNATCRRFYYRLGISESHSTSTSQEDKILASEIIYYSWAFCLKLMFVEMFYVYTWPGTNRNMAFAISFKVFSQVKILNLLFIINSLSHRASQFAAGKWWPYLLFLNLEALEQRWRNRNSIFVCTAAWNVVKVS